MGKKRMSKQALAIIILSILIVISLTFTATYALYTGTAGGTLNSVTIKSGAVVVSLDAKDAYIANRSSISPGDNIFEDIRVQTSGFVMIDGETAPYNGYTYYRTKEAGERSNEGVTYDKNKGTVEKIKYLFENPNGDYYYYVDLSDEKDNSAIDANLDFYFEVEIAVGMGNEVDPNLFSVVDNAKTQNQEKKYSQVCGDIKQGSVTYTYSQAVNYNPDGFSIGTIKLASGIGNAYQDRTIKFNFYVKAIQAKYTNYVRVLDGSGNLTCFTKNNDYYFNLAKTDGENIGLESLLEALDKFNDTPSEEGDTNGDTDTSLPGSDTELDLYAKELIDYVKAYYRVYSDTQIVNYAKSIAIHNAIAYYYVLGGGKSDNVVID